MNPNRERIQKVLAAAGYGSRRACEDLVRDQRVQVNGRMVDELPVLVDPAHDEIRVDGKKLRRVRPVYYLLHKPKGVLCTNRDPAGRRRAIDLLHGVTERVFPVGRLDASSSGLLLMTNDGALAQLLTHPRYGISKTYHATVKGRIDVADLEKLRKGLWLAEGRTQPAEVKTLRRGHRESVLEIKIREGRNRQVRRMLARLGHKVVKLKRIRLGNLTIRGLGPGSFRALTPAELTRLNKLAAKAAQHPAGDAAAPSRKPARRRVEQGEA